MGKESLKDHLDGNELDLSLSNLTKVPVKELAAVPKATRLDLSCNQLSSLPDNFCSLTHIVKIDLSKNNLSCLPENIGNLQYLQHLDLLGNNLEHLPISFGNLRKLRWLDLKDNENLDKDLKKVAGDCLDDKQCKECAQRVVAYMSGIQQELENQHQKKLDKEKKRLAAKERKQEVLRKEKQLQKQQERQKKTEKYEAAVAAKKRKEEQKVRKNTKGAQKVNGSVEHHVAKPQSGTSCLVVCITLFVTVIALGIGIHFFCESDKTNALCIDLRWGVETVVRTANEWTQQLRDQIAS